MANIAKIHYIFGSASRIESRIESNQTHKTKKTRFWNVLLNQKTKQQRNKETCCAYSSEGKEVCFLTGGQERNLEMIYFNLIHLKY